jgi:hypothetical protein
MGYGLSGNVVIASVTVDEHRLHAPSTTSDRSPQTPSGPSEPSGPPRRCPCRRLSCRSAGEPKPPAVSHHPPPPGETFSHPRGPAPRAAPNSRHLQEPSPLHRSTRRVVVGEPPDKARRDSPDGPCDNGPSRARHNDDLPTGVEACPSPERTSFRWPTSAPILGDLCLLRTHRTTRHNDRHRPPARAKPRFLPRSKGAPNDRHCAAGVDEMAAQLSAPSVTLVEGAATTRAPILALASAVAAGYRSPFRVRSPGL